MSNGTPTMRPSGGWSTVPEWAKILMFVAAGSAGGGGLSTALGARSVSEDVVFVQWQAQVDSQLRQISETQRRIAERGENQSTTLGEIKQGQIVFREKAVDLDKRVTRLERRRRGRNGAEDDDD